MVEIFVSDLNSRLVADTDTLRQARKVFRMERASAPGGSKNRNYSKYIYMITPKGLLKTGMLDLLLKYFKSVGIEPKVKDTRLVKKPPPQDDIEINLSYLPYTLREYQEEALEATLEHKNGIIHAATGAGKTVIEAATLLVWNKKSIVLINQVDLALQLREELSFLMDEKVGLIGNGTWAPERVTVCIDRSLHNSRWGKRKKNKVKKFCQSIEHICLDECHHVQSPTWRKIMRRCKNASIRHGFSATPITSEIRTESGFSNLDLYLYSYIGPVIYSMSTRDLIDIGYLAEPEVNIVKNTVYWDGQCLQFGDEYERIIMKDEQRNRAICEIFARHHRAGEQTVGFVDRIIHGETIARMLVDEYNIPSEDIGYVTGETLQDIRKESIEDFKVGQLPIIIGTVLSEGLDFFCDAGINIAGGKSKKNVIQRAGRVLRKKVKLESGEVDTSVKEVVQLYDFADLNHKWFEDHAERRLYTYIEEGHEVRFLNLSEVLGDSEG